MPNNIYLYKLAFKHQSIYKSVRSNNERLEYLGDSVLSLIIAQFVFKKFPDKDEGFLTQMRSRIVSGERLNKIAADIGLDYFIEHEHSFNIHATSILGDTLEALIGAIYLDKGYVFAESFVLQKIIFPYVNLKEVAEENENYKGVLLEWAQREKKHISYQLVNEQKVGKTKMYKIELQIEQVKYGEGIDVSKRNAEQMAAKEACEILGIK